MTPADEIEQLNKLLQSNTIKRGTPQYNAALDRLDELEGM
jgi:hypothetical protein